MCGLFSVKNTKPKQEEKKNTYYIEPAKNPDEETHDEWVEEQQEIP